MLRVSWDSRRCHAIVLALGLAAATSGCIHAPPEVAQAHQRELDVISALKASHLAMIDAFVAERTQRFETFFFHDYAPAYFKNWKEQFRTVNGRPYDEARDFPLFSNDLVAEYQDLLTPLDSIRMSLHQAIQMEYANVALLHQGVGDWIASTEKLNEAQRTSMNRLLDTIKPGLSMESIERATDRALDAVRARLDALAE